MLALPLEDVVEDDFSESFRLIAVCDVDVLDLLVDVPLLVKMDFDFNRKCDAYLFGQNKERALLVSVISPLSDDYDLYDKGKLILDSTADGGCVLVRLGNEETLGRELRAYIQAEKYVGRKNDGTLPETTRRILRDCAEANLRRRERLTGGRPIVCNKGSAASSRRIAETLPLGSVGYRSAKASLYAEVTRRRDHTGGKQ